MWDESICWFTCSGVLVCHKTGSHADIDTPLPPPPSSPHTGNESRPCCYLRSPQTSHPPPLPHVICLAQSPCCAQLLLLNELRHLVLSSGVTTWPSKRLPPSSPLTLTHEPSKEFLRGFFHCLLLLLLLSLLIYGEPVPTWRWICLERKLRYAAQSPAL